MGRIGWLLIQGGAHMKHSSQLETSYSSLIPDHLLNGRSCKHLKRRVIGQGLQLITCKVCAVSSVQGTINPLTAMSI